MHLDRHSRSPRAQIAMWKAGCVNLPIPHRRGMKLAVFKVTEDSLLMCRDVPPYKMFGGVCDLVFSKVVFARFSYHPPCSPFGFRLSAPPLARLFLSRPNSPQNRKAAATHISPSPSLPCTIDNTHPRKDREMGAADGRTERKIRRRFLLLIPSLPSDGLAQ